LIRDRTVDPKLLHPGFYFPPHPFSAFVFCLISSLFLTLVLSYLGSVQPKNHPIIGDLALMLRSPPIQAILLHAICQALQEVVSKEMVPKVDRFLVLLSCLISSSSSLFSYRSLPL
jgi:hypothetical protein